MNAARDAFGYNPVAMGRHFLARFEIRHGDGFMKFDGDGGLPQAEDVPQMTGHFHIAIPGKNGPIAAPNGDSVQAGIADRYGLDGDRLIVDFLFRDAKKGTFKRQHPVAVIARAFREENQIVAPFQALLHFIAMCCRSDGATFNEYCPLQTGQKAKQRPAAHFQLGNERAGQNRAIHCNVEIGGVIADKQRRAGVRHFAVPLDLKGDYAAHTAVVNHRNAFGERQVEADQNHLQRQKCCSPTGKSKCRKKGRHVNLSIYLRVTRSVLTTILTSTLFHCGSITAPSPTKPLSRK